MAIKSDAQRRAVAKYNAANYDRIEIKVPKGDKEKIAQAAAEAGQSVNAFIYQAIRERMERKTDEKSNIAQLIQEQLDKGVSAKQINDTIVLVSDCAEE